PCKSTNHIQQVKYPLLMKQSTKILIGLGMLALLFGSTVMAAKKKFIALPGLTRGNRNNNPGNIRLTDTTWNGKVPNHLNSDGEFEQFYKEVDGVRASIINARTWINRGKNTIRSLITTWSPPKENNTEAYIKSVVKQTGLTEYQTLQPTKAYLKKLVMAIAKHETGTSISSQIFEEAWKLVPNS
ncbi:MAG: hypothetical protein K9H62_23030, partial [Bacteroidales bacterium]|nr:hypothetical protein [Bacteroidales bacterium]